MEWDNSFTRIARNSELLVQVLQWKNFTRYSDRHTPGMEWFMWGRQNINFIITCFWLRILHEYPNIGSTVQQYKDLMAPCKKTKAGVYKLTNAEFFNFTEGINFCTVKPPVDTAGKKFSWLNIHEFKYEKRFNWLQISVPPVWGIYNLLAETKTLKDQRP